MALAYMINLRKFVILDEKGFVIYAITKSVVKLLK